MAFILKNGIWRPNQVPNFAVEVDWSHPLANGLRALHVPGSIYGARDICGINPGPPTIAGGLPLSSTAYGPSVRTNGSSSYVSLPGNTANSPSSDYTIFAGAIVSDQTTTGTIFGKWFFGGKWGVALQATATTGVNWAPRIQYHTSGGDKALVYNARPNPGDFGALATTVNFSTSTLTNYFNGALDSSDNTAGTPFAVSGAPITFGAYYNSGAFQSFLDCIPIYGGFYSRVITAEQEAWRASEPFAMLKAKIARQFYFMPSVGVASGGGGSTPVRRLSLLGVG